VIDGQSGFLVNGEDPDEIAERVLALLNDEALAHFLGTRGMEIARCNNTEAVARQFVQISERVLRQR
jgi:glycosyltransferase involved in cell wall biosynthesis